MLLRNYDNVMSIKGLVGYSDGFKLGNEFGKENLTVKDTVGNIRAVPNVDPFVVFSEYDNVIRSSFQNNLICSSDWTDPDYNDYTMTNICNAKFVTHYYEPLQEITLESGEKAWKRTYKKLYNANTDLTIGTIGVVQYIGYYNSNYQSVLYYKEKLPEVLTVPQYTNFELSFTTIVTQNPNEPPKTEYQTDVTILDEGTDA